MVTWRQVRAVLARLPETREAANKRGLATWITGKRTFVWERPLRASDIKALGAAAPDGPILAVRTDDLEMKDALLGSRRTGLFTTPHFNGYPTILIALDSVSVANLKSVLVDCWIALAPAAARDEYLAKRRKTKAR